MVVNLSVGEVRRLLAALSLLISPMVRARSGVVDMAARASSGGARLSLPAPRRGPRTTAKPRTRLSAGLMTSGNSELRLENWGWLLVLTKPGVRLPPVTSRASAGGPRTRRIKILIRTAYLHAELALNQRVRCVFGRRETCEGRVRRDVRIRVPVLVGAVRAA